MSVDGARLFSGRWNEAGVPMVYTATSMALAAMEMFVHLDPSVAPGDLLAVEIAAPDDLAVEEVGLSSLPKRWRATEVETAELGTAWVRSGRTVMLRVPSAVVEGEWNALLNPAHADFARIAVVLSAPFHFDERMFR